MDPSALKEKIAEAARIVLRLSCLANSDCELQKRLESASVEVLRLASAPKSEERFAASLERAAAALKAASTHHALEGIGVRNLAGFLEEAAKDLFRRKDGAGREAGLRLADLASVATSAKEAAGYGHAEAGASGGEAIVAIERVVEEAPLPPYASAEIVIESVGVEIALQKNGSEAPIEPAPVKKPLALNKRQQFVIEIISPKGRFQLKELLEHFPHLSEKTVRNDLSCLCEAGVLARHGVAPRSYYEVLQPVSASIHAYRS